MRVFVLGTGRSGTVTFIRACEHLVNFSAGHETRTSKIGPERLNYPDQHIEADNRLSWFLGALGSTFANRETLYVHLLRDPEATAQSFRRRWDSKYHSSIIRAFSNGILVDADADPLEVCRYYVETVTENIREFLVARPHMTIRLEEARTVFPNFLDRIRATGDTDRALAEFDIRHNASTPQ